MIPAGVPTARPEWLQTAVLKFPSGREAEELVPVDAAHLLWAVGLGNVQGLGYLSEQGYKVPANMVTFVLGLCSIVNSFFGGHTAQPSRNGIPIMASPEAGPAGGRYWCRGSSF